MQKSTFLNVDAGSKSSGGSAGGAGISALIEIAIKFGVSYLTAKSEDKKNRALLEKLAELDNKQAEELKQRLNESLTNLAKTQVIIEFLNEEKIKKLEAESKKRMVSLVFLGFGVVLVGLIFYKLSKKNNG